MGWTFADKLPARRDSHETLTGYKRKRAPEQIRPKRHERLHKLQQAIQEVSTEGEDGLEHGQDRIDKGCDNGGE